MKYLLGFVMLLSLIWSFYLAMLGMAGACGLPQGLRPSLAGMLIVVTLSVGYIAAVFMEKDDA